MPKTTESDKRNLANCPTGVWFDEVDVFPKIKRGHYSLNRLVAQNLLDTRVEGYLKRQWKTKGSIATPMMYE